MSLKKKYVKPEFHLTYNSGDRPVDELAVLPEQNLSRYVRECKDRRYQINPDFILRSIGGSSVIVPVGDDSNNIDRPDRFGRSHKSDRSGSSPMPGETFENTIMLPNRPAEYLWKIFQEPATESEAVALCAYHFDAMGGQIEYDVYQFIRDLHQSGILEEVKEK